MMNEDTAILDEVLLSMVEGIGARTYRQLIGRFGSASAVLNVSRNDLAGFDFLQPQAAEQLLSARKNIDPVLVIEFCRRNHIDIIPLSDERYPAPLRTISDPPPILYVRGTLLPADRFSIAVIGTRRSTRYGLRQSERLTAALVQNGFTIISGLAQGIDGAAHRTAVNAGGRTIAVLGSGLHRIYPPEHIPLAEEIVQHGGCLISEYPPLHPTAKWTFPQRNRIVSGLSLGVLIIEAPLKSGAMISARLAGEQGRDVFAVPGLITSPFSQGCHQLIRDGAYLTESADDILNVLGPMRQSVLLPGFQKPVRHPNEVSLNEVEQIVLRQFGAAAKTLEAVIASSGLEPHQVLAAVGVLEKKCILRQLSPAEFIRM
ncbi:MAG: DNA-processing protein DprA [Planctomycetaceae bacterium]|jgi:DNA processing protein|nr:DNA-processing protein DprA [Planctomycetaceae bacterium]